MGLVTKFLSYNGTLQVDLIDQMLTIELPAYLNRCPLYWRNFVHSVEVDRKGEPIGELVRSHLQNYGGDFWGSRRDPLLPGGIVFESEELAVIFKLRWS